MTRHDGKMSVLPARWGTAKEGQNAAAQLDPYDAPDVGCSWAEQNQSRDSGRLRTRVDQSVGT